MKCKYYAPVSLLVAGSKKYSYIIGLLVLNILQFTSARAQQVDTTNLPSIWTLQQCINYANENNIQVNTLRLTKESDEQALLLSKAAKDPNLSGSLSQSFTDSRVANATTGVFHSQGTAANNYSLNSSVILYNGGYLNNAIKQNQLLLQSADLNIKAEENSLTIQLTQAYLDILLSKENIIYLEDLVTTSQAQLQQGQLEYNAGSIARKDLVALEAQLANDQYNLITAQNAERQNTLTLKQLLQLPTGYILNVEEPDTVVAIVPVTPLEDAEKEAAAQRPEIKNSQIAVQVAQYDLLKAKAGYKPTISASGSLVSDYYSDNGPKSYLPQLNNNFYQFLGVSVSVPIFTNRIVKTNVENSKIEIKQATLNMSNTQIVLSQEVEQAYLNVLNSQSQYQASVVQLDADKESYRIAAEQLKLGGISTADYLVQKNLYVQALQDYIQAKYNALITEKIYDFYRGIPVKL
jgi:outer membrane protein